ncbi:MAG TPA: excinuclease ABC subunit UvrA [Polyangiaceae bacterium]|nr:excinuclease ABC subunit UvrA [Polyangiaceae bacterium]
MHAPNTAKRPVRKQLAAQAGAFIEVVGAREHNLKVDHLVLPKNAMVVLTGPSGSGKSSLAFDTLYAEGQRRYVESLSTYARQFLGRLDRPAVERLRGLSPTIAIEQKSASTNPRSTVGTITELTDYMRVLWARAGVQHCTVCGKPVRGRSAEEIANDVLALPRGPMLLLAPLVTHRKGEFKDVFEDLSTRGFVRVRIDGEIHRLDALPPLDKKRKHTVELVLDRLTAEPAARSRIAESVELGLREGAGELLVEPEGKAPIRFSSSRSCCGASYPEKSPQSFSFNSPLGMCGACNGLGTRTEIDPALVVPDKTLSIRKGAIAPWAAAMERGEGWTYRIIEAMAKATGVDLDVPFGKLPKKLRDQVLYGLGGKRIRVTWGQEGTDSHGAWGVKFQGIIPTLMRRYLETSSEKMREQYRQYLSEVSCDACEGKRLRNESLAVRLAGKSIADVLSLSVREADAWFRDVTLSAKERAIAKGPLREIQSRLAFLLNVGLEYLTLDRSGPTLSGGEAQRIRLASQLGSELSGVLYVLDEPSIGLHARDAARLVDTLHRLRDLGNSVLVVEHDEGTICAADHVVDFGPGAGHMGGHVVFEGPPSALAKAKGSLTADYVSGRKRIEIPGERRKPTGEIVIRGAREHNLKNIDVRIPLGCLVAVAGPSGAGKSSLINGILLPELARKLHDGKDRVGAHQKIEGIGAIDKVIAIDQQPIGRTPRSNPGTYTKAFDDIRALFAELPEARMKGWNAARFSFNLKGGRCEACEGDGVVRVEMHFLSDVFVTCDVCQGKRYGAETLAVKFKGKSIADVLDLDVETCRDLFSAHPNLSKILRTLSEVGLGYVKIGQPAPTLSGGEAQRIKLSRELSRTQTGKTLYVLDEPTTGLHFEDVRRLLDVLARLVDAGNTVVVIEHHLDVIKCADYVVDLGPGGGDAGGRVVAEGTPEALAKAKGSVTGPYLAKVLKGR